MNRALRPLVWFSIAAALTYVVRLHSLKSWPFDGSISWLSNTGVMTYLFNGQTMGTYYRIKLVSDKTLDSGEQTQLQSQIDGLLFDLNRQMSTYVKTSEIVRFNASHPSSEWTPISKGFFEVVQISHKAFHLTAGAFDPSVKPLVDIWGFGANAREGFGEHLPEISHIEEAKKNVGFDRIETYSNTSKYFIRKSEPRTIDFSAVAKGYGVDRVLDLLLEQGSVTQLIVEIGGELRVWSREDTTASASIGIESPESLLGDTNRKIKKIIRILNQAVATSGSYRNFYTQNGIHYAHALDPRTGRPVTHNLVSLSVVSETCARADALATALLVMGPVEAQNFAKKHKLPIYGILKTETGYTEFFSEPFKALLVE